MFVSDRFRNIHIFVFPLVGKLWLMNPIAHCEKYTWKKNCAALVFRLSRRLTFSNVSKPGSKATFGVTDWIGGTQEPDILTLCLHVGGCKNVNWQ